ncbi:SpoIIE family protein phosphatase [Haloplasma contractile]|uniref:Protein serine-threonine phosphatase n=1 Tax=Haloplasma contractile SSD-17B TaxID=1033810 RepID=F7Q0G9_9MOLU|nr:SpoIIE family protein phosphatase [Haloplasma contractile]ERJ12685.1 Protein serine-threonine phosphatase [Haloplasma contractile SSD-17B]
MTIKYDVNVSALFKHNEEVCGDTTQIIKNKHATTIILSDGLGSGIKASILSILSTKIASRLLERNVSLDQVFSTIASTLPTCKVRGLAYSTLSILKITELGNANLIEYDNPSIMLFRDGQLINIKKQERTLAGKLVYESFFTVELDDVLVMVSDGIINAGVGGLFNLGLGHKELVNMILSKRLFKYDPHVLNKKIMNFIDGCYLCEPGDDSTSIVIKARSPRQIVILTGPPQDKISDREIVMNHFMSNRNSKKIVCGGTTGNIVARELHQSLETSIIYDDPSVPPIGKIKSIDLVTEGILTFNKCLEKIKQYRETKQLPTRNDGASLLTNELINADGIQFIIGTSVNPAHEELMESLQLMPRPVIVKQIIHELIAIGKEIQVEWF